MTKVNHAAGGQQKKRPRKLFIVLGVITAALIALIAFCAVYLNTYSPADSTAAECLVSTDTVTVAYPRDDTIAFIPSGTPTAGFIFYPGGKVEYTAYAPLLHQLAENGVLCLLVKMRCNLAIMSMDRAEGLTALYPEVTNWWIGGHSLGGVAAASFAAKHTDVFSGVVFLASYATENISSSGLQVLSLYGTEDKVLNRASYEKNLVNLPADKTEIVIDGGCHAYFGNYGAQAGDGTPTITREEQQKTTVDAILAAMGQ